MAYSLSIVVRGGLYKPVALSQTRNEATWYIMIVRLPLPAALLPDSPLYLPAVTSITAAIMCNQFNHIEIDSQQGGASQNGDFRVLSMMLSPTEREFTSVRKTYEQSSLTA